MCLSRASSTAVDYVRFGWRKHLEAKLGKNLSRREWRHLRNKVIWVVATEDKVVVDFEITDRQPSYVQLIPLLSRIKKRLREDEIKLFQMRAGQL